jgi:hypothetical protein
LRGFPVTPAVTCFPSCPRKYVHDNIFSLPKSSQPDTSSSSSHPVRLHTPLHTPHARRCSLSFLTTRHPSPPPAPPPLHTPRPHPSPLALHTLPTFDSAQPTTSPNLSCPQHSLNHLNKSDVTVLSLSSPRTSLKRSKMERRLASLTGRARMGKTFALGLAASSPLQRYDLTYFPCLNTNPFSPFFPGNVRLPSLKFVTSFNTEILPTCD